jgi:diguanylate cyclase (GGDEF)-like protein
MWSELTAGRPWEGELHNRRKDGDTYWDHVTITPIQTVAGEVTHFLGVHTDISGRKSLEHQLSRMVYTDELTGLHNRSYLDTHFADLMARVRRTGRGAAVMFLDLDHFKNVNDSLGHEAGDQLLQVVADRLRECVRQDDVIVRQGGDEFVIVLVDVRHPEDVAHVADHIIKAVSAPIPILGRDLAVGTSVGVAMYPSDGEDLATLMKRADAAMYITKRRGRNGVSFYAPDMDARAIERLELEIDLRHAYEREEFYLEYQPQVTCDGEQVAGVEALLRWRCPKRGQVPPARFVSVLEDSGLITTVGDWVIRQAVRQMVAWRQGGHRGITVAVNVSGRQLSHPEFIARVSAILAEEGYDQHQDALEFELTESAIMENLDEAISALHALNQLGVEIAIDDFGTGYSSLSYIKLLPLDTLKIDQVFVRDVMQDETNQAIAKAIIAMGQALGLRVIAEGVETAEQMAFFTGERCDRVQGFYFSASRSASDITAILDGGRRLPAVRGDSGAPA